MNAQFTRTQKLWYATLFMLVAFAFNPMFGQTAKDAQKKITVKGMVSDINGPLESVNVIVKEAKIGTVTNAKGEFRLANVSIGDMLQFSYLGYNTSMVKVTDATTFIEITLTEDVVEFMGAVNSNKRYKSKRKTKRKN